MKHNQRHLGSIQLPQVSAFKPQHCCVPISQFSVSTVTIPAHSGVCVCGGGGGGGGGVVGWGRKGGRSKRRERENEKRAEGS